MRSVAPTPNGLGMFKALASGEVTVVLAEFTSLASAHRAIHGEEQQVSVDSARDLLKKASLEDLKAYHSVHHVKMRSVKLTPWQVLYVPVGWIVAEQASRGVLIYGARCTFAVRTIVAHETYEALISGWAVSNQGRADKMREVLHCLQPSEDAGPAP